MDDHKTPRELATGPGAAPASARTAPTVGVGPGPRPRNIRLYLSLGRRDRMGDAEIGKLLDEKGLVAERIEVRHSHTYLTFDEAAAPQAISTLHGMTHGERTIVCERARR